MSISSIIRRMGWPMATGVVFLGVVSCGDRKQEARSELTAKSFTFTVDEYMRAAREGNVTALRHFLEAGMEVDAADASGTTALFQAAQAGQAEAVRFLAGRGANVEAMGTGFDTPLVAAARTGTLETVKALLEAKADPKVRTMRNSWTALTAAANRGDVDIVKELAPLSPGALDEALQIASLKGQPEVVEVLLQRGADVFSRSKENKTPLMYAAEYGHADAVKLLMLHGSNKLLIDNNQRTAADLAVAKGHKHVVEVLNDPKLAVAAAEAQAAPKAASPEGGASADAAAPAGQASEGASLAAEGTAESGATDSVTAAEAPVVAGAEVATGVPSVEGTTPDGAVAVADSAGGVGPAAVDPELRETVPAAAPFRSPAGEEEASTADGAAGLEAAVAAQVPAPRYERLQGARLAGVSDGSTQALKEKVRVRSFREGQLPIVLEEVPATGASARIRVLNQAGSAPEIVPAGGAIGDTGLELVRVERRFMSSKLGQGRPLDVSHAVVRDRATGERHIVRRNEPATSSEPTAVISAGPAGDLYEVQSGDEFSVGDAQPARYRVLDVRPTQVVVQNLENGETATLARSYAQ